MSRTPLTTPDLLSLLTRRSTHRRARSLPTVSLLHQRDGDAPVLSYDSPPLADPTVDSSAQTVLFVATAPSQDRHGDVVEPRGCEPWLPVFARNPVAFFSHQQTDLPIGTVTDGPGGPLAFTPHDDHVLAKIWLHCKTAESSEVFCLLCEKVLRACSIGFLPHRAELLDEPEDTRAHKGEIVFDELREDPGFLFTEWEPLELSVVPIPSNRESLAVHLHAPGRITSPLVRAALLPHAAPLRDYAHGCALSPMEPSAVSTASPPALTPTRLGQALIAAKKQKKAASSPSHAASEDLVRWNKALSSRFDVRDQELPPASVECEFAAKHIGCAVKDVYQTQVFVPAAKLGSFLSGWRDVTAPFDLLDVRNIVGKSEAPPAYEVIQLNSTRSEDFLVEGTCFYQGAYPWVCALMPTWFGLRIDLYAHREQRAALNTLPTRSWELAATQYNFLKGEAFSLSGEFLPRTGEEFADLFLEAKNEKSLTSTLAQLNDKGLSFANRGAIFMGPPGTGKTLSGRVIRNQADATFIWVSARDFYRSGAFGGLTYGFELAKELAPSVLFIEDVDHWLGDHSVDLLKTEMDGIGRHAGVWTILTTNFPEQLPEALIDRPGRFHDVLLFNLPDDAARTRMLSKWLPGLSGDDFAATVRATAGYSGAHVYELAHFARTLCEQDNRPLPDAVREALRKIKEQRDLIHSATGRGPASARRRSSALPPRGLEVRRLFTYTARSLPSAPLSDKIPTMSTEKSYGQMMESLGHLHATTKSMHETVTAMHKALQDLHARHEALHARHEALHERHESLHKSLQDLHAKVEALKSLTDPDNDGDVHPSGDYTPSPMVHNNASPPPAADWTQLTSVLRELAENQKRTSDAFYALTGR